MAFDREKGFEIDDNGIVIENGPHIIGGSSSPIALSPTLPTVYIQSDGTIWVHQGVGNWRRVGGLNFDFHKVDEPVVVPSNQQMIVEGSFEVTQNGSFQVEENAKFRVREN